MYCITGKVDQMRSVDGSIRSSIRLQCFFNYSLMIVSCLYYISGHSGCKWDICAVLGMLKPKFQLCIVRPNPPFVFIKHA